MGFKGFRSVREYEAECARLGFPTERIPFHWGKDAFFVLVTGAPIPSDTAVKSWHLFHVGGEDEIMSGIVSDGVAWMDALAAHGYFPDETVEADAPGPDGAQDAQDAQAGKKRAVVIPFPVLAGPGQETESPFYRSLRDLLEDGVGPEALSFHLTAAARAYEAGTITAGELSALREIGRREHGETTRPVPPPIIQTTAPGVYPWYPELGEEEPSADLRATLGHYGGHWYVDTPLILKGRGIVESLLD